MYKLKHTINKYEENFDGFVAIGHKHESYALK